MDNNPITPNGGFGAVDQVAQENWTRYEYGRARGHDLYTRQAAFLEGFYMGGDYDEHGRLRGGGQWRHDDIETLNEEQRPAYEFNEVLPAINSAIGYQIHNRLDIAFRPVGGAADQVKADIRSKVAMFLAGQTQLHWKETQIFADGLIEQRGYFDLRMDYSNNIFGELVIDVLDPRDVIPDPDAKGYDPESWSDVTISRWLTLDQVEEWYGREARLKISAFRPDERDFGELDSQGRRNHFGDQLTGTSHLWDAWRVDQGIVRVRVIDRQAFRYEMVRVAVHPTGDLEIVSDDAGPERLAKLEGMGCQFMRRMQRRVRRTISTRDVTLSDGWSPLPFLSPVPFFPYFRRGKTRGMIDNAIGQQQAVNKSISQFVHILNSTANSGWIIEEDSLTNMDTDELEAEGASTGLVLEVKAGAQRPDKIQPNQIPQGIDRIIDRMVQSLKEVTVPDAMRGNNGQEISGVAIQSRQFASQQQLAVPLDNLARTRHILAKRIDWFIGTYYDTERVIRITETDPVTGEEVANDITINQYDPATGTYLNDMTVGKYDTVISEQPMQVTFENSQFTQGIELRKAGVAIPDWAVVKHSNLADKQEILAEMRKPQQQDPEKEAKAKLLAAQAEKTTAEVDKVRAETVNKNVEAQFGAIQTAQTITAIPQTSPLADMLLRSGGYVDHDAAPIIPQAAPVQGVMPAQEGQPAQLDPQQVEAIQRRDPATAREVLGRRNTHPNFPANPADPDVGVNAGIQGGQ